MNVTVSRTIPVIMVVLLGLAGCSSAAGDAFVQRGLRAYQNQDFDLAVTELERALQHETASYELEEVYTLLGRAYEAKKDYPGAIAAHLKAIELDPEFHTAWVNLGIAYRLNGNLDEAEESYMDALRLEPNYAELHASLGALYIFKNEPERALQTLKHAIELDPQLAVAHANIAVAYALTGRFEQAEAALAQATALGYRNGEIIKARINASKALFAEEPNRP